MIASDPLGLLQRILMPAISATDRRCETVRMVRADLLLVGGRQPRALSTDLVESN